MSSSIWSESSKPILLSYCHGFGTGIALHCREIQRTTMKKALKIHFQPPLNEAKCVFEYRSLYQALIREGNGRFYTKIKYLGLILDRKLAWNHHISELSKKLSRAVIK